MHVLLLLLLLLDEERDDLNLPAQLKSRDKHEAAAGGR
jgi:hypothetical protein